MGKTFNLYCDESCHMENDGNEFMLLGYIKVAQNEIKDHKQQIKNLRKHHNYLTEFKWSKISESKERFFIDLLNYHFKCKMSFRCIIIPKNVYNIKNLGLENPDDLYYQLYRVFLGHDLDLINVKYNIYIDKKDGHSKQRVGKLKKNLMEDSILKIGNDSSSGYGNVQLIDSKESVFVQLCDVFLGAISYKLRKLNSSEAKLKVLNRIEKEQNLNLDPEKITQNGRIQMLEII